jgi:hypothetical protein
MCRYLVLNVLVVLGCGLPNTTLQSLNPSSYVYDAYLVLNLLVVLSCDLSASTHQSLNPTSSVRTLC